MTSIEDAMKEKIKIIVLIERSNYLAYFNGIVRDSNFRDDLELWCDVTKVTGAKGYTSIGKQTLDELSNYNVVTYSGTLGLKVLLESREPLIIFSLHARSRYVQCNFRKHIFIRIQQLLDSFTFSDSKTFADCDFFFGASNYWLELAIDNYRKLEKLEKDLEQEIRRKFIPVSFLKLIGIERLNDDRRLEIKKKYGFDPNKKIILLLPLPIKGLGFWAQCFATKNLFNRSLFYIKDFVLNFGREFFAKENNWDFSISNHHKLHKLLGELKKKENAYLVVKQRLKNEIHPDLAVISDRIFYDQSQLDPVIYELLNIADLCVHYDSAVVFEAAQMGVYSVSIQRPLYSKLPQRAKEIWRNANKIPSKSMLGYDGVSKRINISKGLEEFIDIKFDSLEISDDSRRRYLDFYCGDTSGAAMTTAIKKIISEFRGSG